MAVNFVNQGHGYKVAGKRRAARWIKDAVENEGFRAGEITFVFCSREYHLSVNRQYLGHDYSTDVITFDYGDTARERIIAGDILIDPATVAGNAACFSVPEDEEMKRVMIHGVLHLCGYGDGTPEEKERMREREDFYLARFAMQP